MSETQRIVDQLDRAFQGEAWHGSSVQELLDGVDARRAAARPLKNAHSIWEITLHIAAWKDAVRRRIEGEAVELSGDTDWPPMTDTSEDAWRAANAALERAHRALAETARRLDDRRLLGPVPGRDYDAYFLLHGVIQHDLYHAGQIALLLKG